MEMNIMECLKERRDFGRTDNFAHIQLERNKDGSSVSVTLKNINPSGITCFSSVALGPGERVNVSIPHMKGLFEAGARILSLKKVLRRYELALKFFEMRRDIPSL